MSSQGGDCLRKRRVKYWFMQKKAFGNTWILFSCHNSNVIKISAGKGWPPCGTEQEERILNIFCLWIFLSCLMTSSLKSVMPSNTPNVRRTKRIRLRPLEYWRGERVNYTMKPSGISSKIPIFASFWQSRIEKSELILCCASLEMLTIW